MKFVLFITLLLLTCCTSKNHYYEPPCPADRWVSTSSDEQVPNKWWKIFNDPLLTCLIEKSYRDNYELKSAFEKTIQAYYLRRQISAKYLPQINLSFDAIKSFNQFAIGSAFFGGGGTFNFANGASQNLFIGGFDALWEIDLFQNTYYQVLSVCALQGAFKETYHLIQVSLSSEIAKNYFDLKWHTFKQDILKKQITNREKKLTLIRSLKEKGIESAIPSQDALAELKSLKEELFQTEALKKASIFKIIALIGELPPQMFDQLLSVSSSFPSLPQKLATSIPSDVLRKRPDVRKAEMLIAQASAEINVAITDFFPKLNLLGTAKREKTTFGSISSTGPAWSIGSHLFAPVFQGGRLQAQLNESKSYWRQNVYDYYDIVTKAIAEAETAISAYLEGQLAEKEALNVFLAKQRKLEKIKALFSAGIVNEITFLDTENETLIASLTSTQATYKQLLNLIFTFKALGGGWDIEEDQNLNNEKN